MDHLAQLIVLTLAAGTPLVYAALGELVTEKSGVLNLGVEGMMVVGAVTSFIVAASTQSPWLGVAAGMAAGAALSLIFGVLTLSLMANQVASGLALSLFGIGLSAFFGLNYVSVVINPIPPLAIPGLSDLPVVGKLLFGHNPLVYLSLVLFVAIQAFLYRTRAGLIVRAVGESPQSAHAIGLPVARIRYCAVMFGGACAGLGGAYMAVAYTPMWVEGMTAGTRLDRAGAGRVRQLEALADPGGRLPLRRRHARAVPGAGDGRGHSFAVAVDAALPGHHRRAGDHLPRRRRGPPQCPRLPRQAVPPGLLTQRDSRRRNIDPVGESSTLPPVAYPRNRARSAPLRTSPPRRESTA